jgi:hypothetical protein
LVSLRVWDGKSSRGRRSVILTACVNCTVEWRVGALPATGVGEPRTHWPD